MQNGFPDQKAFTQEKCTSHQMAAVNSEVTCRTSAKSSTQSLLVAKSVLRDICLDELHKSVKMLHEKTSERIEETLATMVQETVRVFAENNLVKDKVNNLLTDGYNNGKRARAQDKKLPEKKFVARNSLLTDLFEIKHIRSIYHMFLAVIIISFMNTCLCDLLENGTIRLGLKYIILGMGRFHIVIMTWCIMFTTALLAYPAFKLWAIGFMQLRSSTFVPIKLWNWSWLSVLVTYYAAMLYLPMAMKEPDLPMGSVSVILAEQIRILMKVHAFVRTNVSRVLMYKPHVEHCEQPIPVFRRYWYFLFAPTLVYRDEYPRTNRVSWKLVSLHLLEMFGCVFLISFVVERHLVPTYRNFGVQPHTWKTLTMAVFGSVLPGSTMMLCTFYLLLHSWLNCWAEMLTFADRLFYKDWWNMTSFGAFYRTWNVVIHDFLYTYIYKDMYEIIVPGAKPVAVCTVLLISASVHEYILTCLLGFCYPVLFVEFAGFGMALAFLHVRESQFLGNIMLWWGLAIGIGVQASLYTMEYYARINCPPLYPSHLTLDLFIPRSWACNGISSSS